MSNQEDLRPVLNERAVEVLGRLSASEREALLIKGWMSHDARWFMAVVNECGLEVASRLNQTAARELGKAEVRRIVRALQLPPVAVLEDYLLVQEVLIALLGPDLLDYGVTRVGDDAYQIHIRRCFANENAERAGIGDQYACGIFARVCGWLDALDLNYEMTPALGRCLKAQGQECAYTFRIKVETPAVGVSGEMNRGLS